MDDIKKTYEQYLKNFKFWKQHFDNRADDEVRSILWNAAKENKHPRAYFNDLSNPETNLLVDKTLFSFTSEAQKGMVNGVMSHYVVVLYQYLRYITFFQTIEEIHQGIVNSYKEKANEYKANNDMENYQRIIQRIPEEGTVSGRILELYTAKIAIKSPVIRETIDANGKKTVKRKSGYKIALEYVNTPWNVELENAWKNGVKHLNQKGKKAKDLVNALTLLADDTNDTLSPEEKVYYVKEIFDSFKVLVYDKNQALWDDIKTICNEVIKKQKRAKQAIKDDYLEKQLEKQRNAQSSKIFRQEMGLPPLDEDILDVTQETWEEKTERQNMEQFQELSSQEESINEFVKRMVEEAKKKNL